MVVAGNLATAARDGRIRDVIDLYNADQDILGGIGASTALSSAIQAGKVESIQTLWNLGARLQDWGSGMTELHLASYYGREEVARFLLVLNCMVRR